MNLHGTGPHSLRRWIGLAIAFTAIALVAGDLQGQSTKRAATESAQTAQTQPTQTQASQDKSDPLAGLGTSEAISKIYQMLAWVLIILIIGVVAFVVVKKFLPRIGKAAGGQLSVSQTIYLSPKQAVHLLKADTQRFLIATSKDSVCLLAELRKPFPPEGFTESLALDDQREPEGP